ncbi:cobyrinic acid a,c-diamide synthase [Paenibacillus sp. PCH8]|uniref:MinD/ParA family protein n=1 Tax=Paenibacillus sp. PCH8 TaxID=2066524 RepID=UPI000CFA2C55|nr:MinD/ParA family protein [Paenibacillus sp. PCH8]PQP80626.1 cobyrinic acid a,c-diamide synthase [Paenibacillus sp. PCH8]
MKDQAASLRSMVSAPLEMEGVERDVRSSKIITVASGKGGVGKSNFTLNFALALQALGQKVLVFDADIGMANIDVLMGTSSSYNLYHLLYRQKTIREIIQLGASGLPYIAGGSGMKELFSLSDRDLEFFASQVEDIAQEMDYVIFDTGAGLSRENMKFIGAADECLIITTPEPTSITDAYALVKVMHGQENATPFRMIVNRVEDEREAERVADKIAGVARRFLQTDIPLLGYISEDAQVVKAVKRQMPYSLAYPNAKASKDIEKLALQYLAVPATPESETLTGIRGFMKKWLKRTT